VVGEIVACIREMHVKIVGGRELPKPPLKSPSNVRCTPNEGYFEMAAEKKERTLTVSAVEDVRADAAHDRALEEGNRVRPWDRAGRLRPDEGLGGRVREWMSTSRRS
jgi:hypothetical protein